VRHTARSRAKRLRVALGTLVAVEAVNSSSSAAETALAAAFAALTEVERRLHPHSPASDLARINHAPPGTVVAVHTSTCELLGLARHLNRLSDGVFDPCLPTRPGRLSDVEVADHEVVCHAPVALDFGGFAKGHAVDCAIAALLAHGCSSGLVNAGGDLRLFGPDTEPVLLRGPADELTQIPLVDTALAVTDANSQRRPAEHQGYYNADPLVRNYAAVLAGQAVVADALTKCVLLCPQETAGAVLRAFDATQLAINKSAAEPAGDRCQ
jgi:FAD:protein FMN transferase